MSDWTRVLLAPVFVAIGIADGIVRAAWVAVAALAVLIALSCVALLALAQWREPGSVTPEPPAERVP